jgi:hypothetical protein
MSLFKYPNKWVKDIPTTPTRTQFLEAWIWIFERGLEKCKVSISSSDNKDNITISVTTDNRSIHHGGFGFHTLTPNTDEYYYSGSGCDWNTDKDGIRYYLLDRATKMPVNWCDVKATTIIRNFLINSDKIQVINKGEFFSPFERDISFNV